VRLGESSREASRPKRARKAGPRGEAQEPCPHAPGVPREGLRGRPGVEPLPRNLRVTSPLLSLDQPEDDLRGVKGHVRRDLHGLGKRGENDAVGREAWIAYSS
jgi:hypothetical protein